MTAVTGRDTGAGDSGDSGGPRDIRDSCDRGGWSDGRVQGDD